jgi:hypothetical protein
VAGLLHNNAGAHALRAGDISAAQAHLERAAQAMREIGADSQFVSVNLGWVLRQENDPHGARDTFEASLRMSRHSGERAALAYASLGLACVAGDVADWDRAAKLHGTAQALVERTGEPWQEPEAGYRLDSLDKVRASSARSDFSTLMPPAWRSASTKPWTWPCLRLGPPLHEAGCPGVERLQGRSEVLPCLFTFCIQAPRFEDPPVA